MKLQRRSAFILLVFSLVIGYCISAFGLTGSAPMTRDAKSKIHPDFCLIPNCGTGHDPCPSCNTELPCCEVCTSTSGCKALTLTCGPDPEHFCMYH